MADVFISYKRERRAHARRLAAIIEAYGFDVWWDYNLLIDAGDYDAQIERKLSEAKTSIVLWCSGSRASGFVKDEARRANEAGKLLSVVIERGVEPPLGFGSKEAAFLIDWKGEPEAPGVDKIIAALERAAKRPRTLRPNLLDTLREAAPLGPVEPMVVTDATDSNAPRGKRSSQSSAADTLLHDLRATWERLDKRNETVLKRFKERVETVARGSGLEFEVDTAIDTLAADLASRREAEARARDDAARKAAAQEAARRAAEAQRALKAEADRRAADERRAQKAEADRRAAELRRAQQAEAAQRAEADRQARRAEADRRAQEDGTRDTSTAIDSDSSPLAAPGGWRRPFVRTAIIVVAFAYAVAQVALIVGLGNGHASLVVIDVIVCAFSFLGALCMLRRPVTSALLLIVTAAASLQLYGAPPALLFGMVLPISIIAYLAIRTRAPAHVPAAASVGRLRRFDTALRQIVDNVPSLAPRTPTLIMLILTGMVLAWVLLLAGAAVSDL